MIVSLRNLFTNYFFDKILIVLIYILRLICFFFLLSIYLTILYLIILFRSNTYILINIVVFLIYLRNTFTCSLSISFFFVFDKKRSKIYIEIVFATLYIQVINKYLHRNNSFVVDKKFDCYTILQIYICLYNF